MRRDDVDAFIVEMAKTAETFGAECSEGRALGYFEALVDVPLEAVVQGLRSARRRCRFFPSPAEIHDLIFGAVEDRAREAWRRVLAAIEHVGTYESVDFGDPTIHAVIEAMGGWHRAWTWERVEGPEGLGLERDFVSLYRLYAERGPCETASAVLAGQHAIHNWGIGEILRGEMPAERVVRLDAGGRRAITERQLPALAPQRESDGIPGDG